MKDLIIIKFGGSSITKKADNKFEMNYSVLNQAAEELSKAIKKTKKKVIIVCGVGPFGHTNVVKYNLNNGISNPEQFQGVEITNKDCDYVGKETITALSKFGLKAKLIPGYEVCKQSEKKVTSFNEKPYEFLIESGIIPVTTGVMVEDDKLVWSVMSGDKVIAQLAKKLKPELVLMGTDVDGIYTADPKTNSDAELITEITKKNVPIILEKVGESKSVDVTGGMKGKLTQLAEQLNGVRAEVFNIMKKNNLYDILIGKNINDTKIKL